MLRFVSILPRVLDDGTEEGVGAVLQEHRLVPIELNPIGAVARVEGAGAGLVSGEDEEVVTDRHIVGGEGDLHTIVDDIEDFAEEIFHFLVFLCYDYIISTIVPKLRYRLINLTSRLITATACSRSISAFSKSSSGS